MQRRSALVASLAIVLLAACSSAPKKNKELAYHAESFNPDSPFEMSFEQAPAAVCDAGRRALLSQGYVIEEIKPDWVKARKFFQPNSSVHVQINFTLSCLTEGEGAEVFANAREVRDELKSTSSNAGVSVAGIGSVNLPLGTSGASLQRRLDHHAKASEWTAKGGEKGIRLDGGPTNWQFTQEVAADRFPVWIFGAGHVAQALVRQLPPLGAAITWIDSRDEAFADIDTGGFDTRIADMPESEVASAPAGTFFIVMTHSHAQDFALCEAIYRRHDFAYFGLIGSHSKRASFERRLLDRGLAHQRLSELTCPIGIPGIVGKQPAAIALAVAAEILQIHHARQLLGQVARPRLLDRLVRPFQPE